MEKGREGREGRIEDEKEGERREGKRGEKGREGGRKWIRMIISGAENRWRKWLSHIPGGNVKIIQPL